MSNQTNKEIAHEVGQEVYVKGTIVKTYPEQGFVDVLLKDGANVPLGTPAYDTSQIVPVPRDGEYRLTMEELAEIFDNTSAYIAEKARMGVGTVSEYPKWRNEGIKQWLSENGKEVGELPDAKEMNERKLIMSNNQFEPGKRVLVEGVFDMNSWSTPDCAWVTFPCACASPEPTETHCITLAAIHPASCDGEYRLTREEIMEMIEYAEDYTAGCCSCDKPLHFEIGINTWLENHKRDKA